MEHDDMVAKRIVDVASGMASESKRPARRSKGRCPPHGPLLVEVSAGKPCVARCLACGVCGPETPDSSEAKLAFEECFHSP